MTRVVVDAAFRSKLDDLDGLVELCDETGRILGYFHPLVQGSGSAAMKVQSPFTDEQIHQRQQQRAGRPLGEILEDLGGS